MTPEEAKEIMDKMANNVSTFWLPEGFKVSIDVPIMTAELARQYYDRTSPFRNNRPIVAGEVFYYAGIRCIAS